MKYTLLLIALCIAATALTSGEYSSAYMDLSATPTTINLNELAQTPNKTTHSPNTTTHSPNTTTHNPNSTTSVPSTTTTPLPVPTPSTNMTVGKYYVTDPEGTRCIMLDLAIGIRVNTSKVNGTFIVQPSKTNFSGECLPDVASIILNFAEGDISLKFTKNDATKKVYVEYVQYDLTYAFKTGVLSNYTGTNRSLELFSVDVGHSYSCKAETLYMGGGVSLDLTHNRVQAFHIKNSEFGPPELCKADIPDYRVAITVGIILVLLIIIVVIAYLINRKRRTDGYQSL